MSGPVASVLVHVFRVSLDPPAAPSGVHTRVEVMRASPRFLQYRLLGFAIGATFFALALLATSIATMASGDAEGWIAFAIELAVGAPLLACGYLAVRIDFDLRYYVLTERSLRVRQGAWIVDEKTITYANVQNVRITQGPLQRLFGISDVRVDTAGGGVVPGKHGGMGGHNVVIAGIENAAAVRDGILAHLRHFGRGAGLGDVEDERAHAAGFRREHVAVLRELAVHARALREAAQRRVG